MSLNALSSSRGTITKPETKHRAFLEFFMSELNLSWITNFIWGIADDVLRDLYVRGKYRDVILPMTVLRRLDAVLEPSKQAVLDMKVTLDKAQVANQDPMLRQAAGQAFYNTSQFTLRDLKGRGSQQALRADFEAYLDGFSPNVQDILENFEFRNQIPRLSKADALGTLIEKFLSPDINLSPNPVLAWVERLISPLTVHIGFKSDLDLPAFLAQAGLKPVSIEKINIPRIWSLVTCIKA